MTPPVHLPLASTVSSLPRSPRINVHASPPPMGTDALRMPECRTGAMGEYFVGPNAWSFMTGVTGVKMAEAPDPSFARHTASHWLLPFHLRCGLRSGCVSRALSSQGAGRLSGRSPCWSSEVGSLSPCDHSNFKFLSEFLRQLEPCWGTCCDRAVRNSETGPDASGEFGPQPTSTLQGTTPTICLDLTRTVHSRRTRIHSTGICDYENTRRIHAQASHLQPTSRLRQRDKYVQYTRERSRTTLDRAK